MAWPVWMALVPGRRRKVPFVQEKGLHAFPAARPAGRPTPHKIAAQVARLLHNHESRAPQALREKAGIVLREEL